MTALIGHHPRSTRFLVAVGAVTILAANAVAQTRPRAAAGTAKSGIAPLVVVMMGDPQIPMVPRTREHVRAAMEDLRAVPYDFLAVLGDLVQNQAKYYADYRTLILRQANRPVFSLAGNGDRGAGLDAYREATHLPLYYAIERRGIRFIFLSTVRMSGRHRHICHLGEEQMRWLKQELARKTHATTIIFSHAPVFETTWHSEDRSGQKMPGSMHLAESGELRELFKKHANIKMLAHGHLHHRYGQRDDHGRTGYFLEDGVLHVSVGATANGQGSSVLYVEPDRLLVRVRDHAHKKWDDRFQYEYNVKTTLAPATDPPETMLKEIAYTSSADASEQRAMFFAPDVGEAVPLIVALHTWSGNYTQKSHQAIARWCIENHWAFIHPNFRGPNWRPEATGSKLVVQDIVDAVQFAKKATRIDASAVYLIGTSGGGYTALLMAGRHPELWAGVSAWVPISDLKAWYIECKKAKRGYFKHIVASCGGVPGESPEVDRQYRNRSPLTWLAAAKGLPLHINAGINDGHAGSVPVSHSLRAFNQVADPTDRISEEDIRFFVEKAEVPPPLKTAISEPSYGDRPPLFRKSSGDAIVTIFRGGHELVANAALAWIQQLYQRQRDKRHERK